MMMNKWWLSLLVSLPLAGAAPLLYHRYVQPPLPAEQPAALVMERQTSRPDQPPAQMASARATAHREVEWFDWKAEDASAGSGGTAGLSALSASSMPLESWTDSAPAAYDGAYAPDVSQGSDPSGSWSGNTRVDSQSFWAQPRTSTSAQPPAAQAPSSIPDSPAPNPPQGPTSIPSPFALMPPRALQELVEGQPTVHLHIEPNPVKAGHAVTIRWTVVPPEGASALDWIGFFASADALRTLPLHRLPTAGRPSGELTYQVPPGFPPGRYHVRYLVEPSSAVLATTQVSIVAEKRRDDQSPGKSGADEDGTDGSEETGTEETGTDETEADEGEPDEITPAVYTLSVEHTRVVPGEAITVTWSVAPATAADETDTIELCASPALSHPLLPEGARCFPFVQLDSHPSGQQPVSLPEQMPLGAYTLRYVGAGSSRTSVALEIIEQEPDAIIPPPDIIPPSLPTVTFSASPSVIEAGQESLLSWTSTEAHTCLAADGWSGERLLSGSELVGPSVATTYRLTCTGDGGSATDSVTVTVHTVLVDPPATVAEDAAYAYLAQRMDAYLQDEQLRLIESYFSPYPPGPDGQPLTLAALTADSAMAVLAWLARGREDDLRRAKLICDALLWYQRHDPMADGRLRQAYQVNQLLADSTAQQPIIPSSLRATRTADVAWPALAWLTYFERVRDPQTATPREDARAVYLQAAIDAADMLIEQLKAPTADGGFFWGLRDTQLTSFSLQVSPSRVAPGGIIAIDWTAPADRVTANDVIELSSAFGADSSPTNGEVRGRLTNTMPNIPSAFLPITLTVRYLSGGSGEVMIASSLRVEATAPAQALPPMPQPEQEVVTEAVTEHNALAYVLFTRLFDLTGESRFRLNAAHAKHFLEEVAWDASGGKFWAGTSNQRVNAAALVEDAQSLPLLALGRAALYGSALDWVDQTLRVSAGEQISDGFSGYDAGIHLDTDAQPDGIWFQGSAQMTLAYQVAQHSGNADYYLTKLDEAQHHPRGDGQSIVEASHDGVSSGVAGHAYYASPHVGTTAWYLLAKRRSNPLWSTSTEAPVPHESPETTVSPLSLRVLALDVNGDGTVSQADVDLVAGAFGQTAPEEGTTSDLDGDGAITIDDVFLVAKAVGLSWPPTDIPEGRALTFFVKGTGVEESLLSYTAAPLPQGACFHGLLSSGQPGSCTARQFQWTPSSTQGGSSYPLTFTVSDGRASSAETMTVTVQNNTPPVLAPIGDKQVTVSGKLTVALTFTVSASDPEAQPLTLTARLADGR
ncbi:MAG: hypothetical protein HY353_02330, partial [Candidatus Omnitrophica bacterium]|nr:hypothetical protein [Candidatus Omnitrophota bacterium]